MDRVQHELLALGIVKTRFSLAQRESLGAALIPAHGGRGLTHSAQTEWRRLPDDLDETAMTWLFVVGQMPSCSKQRDLSERERQGCESLYQTLLAEIPRLR